MGSSLVRGRIKVALVLVALLIVRPDTAFAATKHEAQYEEGTTSGNSRNIDVDTNEVLEFHVNGIFDNIFFGGLFRIEWLEFPGGVKEVIQRDFSDKPTYPDPSYFRKFPSPVFGYFVQVDVFLDDNFVFQHQWIVTATTPDTEGPFASRPDLSSFSDSGYDSSDNITNDETPTFSWTEPSDRGGGTIVGYKWEVDDPAPDRSTSATQITTGSLSNGAHTLYVRAIDDSGNPGDVGEIDFRIDTSAPGKPSVDLQVGSDSGKDNDDNLTNDSTPTVSFTASGLPYRFWYEVDDPSPDGGPSESTSWTTPSLSDGQRTVYVLAEDAAGNLSRVGSLGITIDTTGPGLVQSLSIIGGATWNINTTPKFQWDDASDASGIDSYWWSIDDNTPTQGWTNQGNTSQGDDATPPSLSDGAHIFRALAVDDAGNLGSIRSLTFTIDGNDPSVPELVKPVGEVVTDGNPLFEWTPSSDGSGSGVASYILQVRSDILGHEKLLKTVLTGTSYTPTGVETLPEERLKWRVMAIDVAGRESGWTGDAFFTVDLDTTPPSTVQNLTIIGGATWNINTTPKFQWDDAIDASGIDSYWWSIDDDTPTQGWTHQNEGILPEDATAPTLSDGEHTFRVFAVDDSAHFNAGPISSVTFTIDGNNPSLPRLVKPVGEVVTDGNPLFEWTPSSDGSGSGVASYILQVRSDILGHEKLLKTVLTGTSYTPTGVETLPEERLKWRVMAIDVAGRESGWTGDAFFTVDLDTTPPSTVQNLTIIGGATWNINTTPKFQWDDAIDASGIDSYWWSIDDDTPTQGWTHQNEGILPEDATAPTLSDGEHTFRVFAVDDSAHFNAGPISSVTFTIDGNNPSLPRLVKPIGEEVTDGNPLFEWSPSSDGAGSGVASYILQVRSDVLGRVKLLKTVLTGTSYTPTGVETLPEERLKWRVRAIDVAGRESPWTEDAFFTVALPAISSIQWRDHTCTNAIGAGTIEVGAQSKVCIYFETKRLDGELCLGTRIQAVG